VFSIALSLRSIRASLQGGPSRIAQHSKTQVNCVCHVLARAALRRTVSRLPKSARRLTPVLDERFSFRSHTPSSGENVGRNWPAASAQWAVCVPQCPVANRLRALSDTTGWPMVQQVDLVGPSRRRECHLGLDEMLMGANSLPVLCGSSLSCVFYWPELLDKVA